jgi:hemoglobin/transferrin/lactoferrin receptor protein
VAVDLVPACHLWIGLLTMASPRSSTRAPAAGAQARRIAASAAAGLTVACGLMVAAAVGPAAAQSVDPGDDTVPAAPAAVPPGDVGVDDDGVLEEITVTATRTAEPVDRSLSGTSVLDRSTIQTQTNPNRPSDFLDLLPGVTTSEEGGDPATAINIRGLQDFGRVNVMVDGARQNFQTSGHNANGAFYIDPEMIRSVDVTRGATATVYGSGAIGGVVDFRTLTADDVLSGDQMVGGFVKAKYSTNGPEPLGHGEFAGRIGQAFDVVTAGTWSRAEDYRDGNHDRIANSWDDLLSGLAKARYRPTEDQQITASALLYRATFDKGTTTVRYTEATTETYSLGHVWTPLDNDLVDLRSNLYYTTTRTDQTEVAGSNVGSKRTFDVATTGFDVNNTSRFATGPVGHALTYGVDGFFDEVANTDDQNSSNKFTPSGRRSVYGGFVQDQATWEWLEVIGAMRLDGYELTGGKTDSTGGRASPKLTVGVTPVEWVTVFATYAEAYRAPAVTETLINGIHPGVEFEFKPNPNLKPEVAHEVEGGVNLRFDNVMRDGDRVRVKAVAYYNQVDDYIDLKSIPIKPPPPPPAPGYYYQYRNVDRATLWGGELEAIYDIGFAFAGLSGQVVRGVDEDTGKDLASVPPDRLIATLGGRAFDARLVAGTRISMVAGKDGSPSGWPESPGYATVDLFASYQVTERISANLNLDNILNRQYTQYLDLSASPGFNARLAVGIKL